MLSSLRSSTFITGGWWRKALRPGVAFDSIPAVFQHLCTTFPAAFHDIDTPESHALMHYFVSQVDTISNWCCEATEMRTVIHGDFKTSNLFFDIAAGNVGEFLSSHICVPTQRLLLSSVQTCCLLVSCLHLASIHQRC